MARSGACGSIWLVPIGVVHEGPCDIKVIQVLLYGYEYPHMGPYDVKMD